MRTPDYFDSRPTLLQPALEVGPVDDPLEREADGAAERLMQSPDPGAIPLSGRALGAQRACASCEEEASTLQRAAEGEDVSPTRAPTSIDVVLGRSGQPLSDAIPRGWGASLGINLGAVRVHADAEAAAATRAVSARAWTVGTHIAFSDGGYQPHTPGGRRLIAHELTHVAQQTRGAVRRTVLQRQLPQEINPPTFGCTVDPFMVARLIGGDKRAALEVLNCCGKNLPILGSGCTKDIIDAARKLLGGDTPGAVNSCRDPDLFEPGRRGGPHAGLCCVKGRPQSEQSCCDVTRAQVDPLRLGARCCPPGQIASPSGCTVFRPVLPLPWSPPASTPVPAHPPSPAPPPPRPPTPVSVHRVGFIQDAPQPWYNPASSYGVSTTATGKAAFEGLVAALKPSPDRKVALLGHASIERPANDPTYNQRLTVRRVTLIRDELRRRGVGEDRLADAPDGAGSDCAPIGAGARACGDNRASMTISAEDRAVEARIFG